VKEAVADWVADCENVAVAEWVAVGVCVNDPVADCVALAVAVCMHVVDDKK